MYKIGEFSKITSLTVKTLHYYDEEGILKASKYQENGYRLYSEADYHKAKRILLLRQLDFSIREIKDVLSNIKTDDDLQDYLLEKQQLVRDKIQKQKEILNKIDTYLLPNTSKGESRMKYEMRIETIEPIEVATMRFIGNYPTMGEYIGKLFKYLKSKAVGAPFACYHDGEYKEEADIEICVPIKEHVSGTNEITIKTLPKIRALVTTHVGKYENLNNAYKAIMDYAKQKEIEMQIPSREVYVKGPGMILKGNPDKYITEIMIPIKE